MSTIERASTIPPELMAEMQERVEPAAEGVMDPKASRIACERRDRSANKGDVLNCRGKMPRLLRCGLPGSSNLPNEFRMSALPTPNVRFAHLGDLPRQGRAAGPAVLHPSLQPSPAREGGARSSCGQERYC
jgi:hypothetical protein